MRAKVAGYRDLLRLPQTWGLTLTRVLGAPVWWFYLFWLPKFLAAQFGVRAIPTMLLFKNGAVADQYVGRFPQTADVGPPVGEPGPTFTTAPTLSG